MKAAVKAVLFDLDGTLADTAPDLGDALNCLLEEEGRDPLPAEEIRKHASFGAKGLLTAGFGADSAELKPDSAGEQRLSARFLALYAQRLCNKTRLFPGAEALLKALDERGVAWGVVTNKSKHLTDPILQKLGLYESMRCLVCGDMVEHKKPAPDALLRAAETLAIPPAECLYVGDSERDVAAAKAAGMPVLAVAYGYEAKAADLGAWDCDGVADELGDILSYMDGVSGRRYTA